LTTDSAKPERMWGNGRPRAFQALRYGFESRHSLQTVSARGAIGRRGTFRPCRSGFESPRADQTPVRSMEGRRALNPQIVVRSHVCQPASHFPLVGWWQQVTRPAVNRKDPGSSPGPTASFIASVTQRSRARLLSGTRWVRLPPLAPTRFRPTAGHPADHRRIGVRVLEPGPTSTKCCWQHGALVRRRRGFDSRRRLHFDQRAGVVMALG
jgi:hypothetical protein